MDDSRESPPRPRRGLVLSTAGRTEGGEGQVTRTGATNRRWAGPVLGRKMPGGSALRKVVKAVFILGVLAVLAAVAKMPGRKREVPPSEPPAVNVTGMTVTAETGLPDTF